jgi:DNA modification methylase
MKKVNINELLVHPELKDLTVSKNQVEKMSYLLDKFGQIQPILYYEKNGSLFVIDGIIRLAAAKNLKWDQINAMKIDWQSDEVILNRCVSNNISKRTYWNLAHELDLFINTLVGKQRGKKRNIEDVIKLLDDVDENKLDKVKKDINLLAIEFYGLSFKKGSLRWLMRMYEKHKNGPQELLDLKLFEKLDNEEISLSRAYELTEEYFQTKKEQGKNALTDVIEYSRNPINGDTQHKVYCHTNEDLSFLEDGKIQTFICSPPYFGKQAIYKNAEKNINGMIHGNEKLVEDYINNEVIIYRQIKSKMKDNGSLFVIIGDSHRGDDNRIPERLVVAMLNDGWHCPSTMYWLKNNQKPQKVNGRLMNSGEHVLHFTLNKNHKWREFINWTDEPISLGRTSGEDYIDGIKRPGFYLKRPYERFRTFLEEQKFVGILRQNCFNVDEVREFGKPNHPCPFPINLPLFLTLLTTEISDTVCDIYGGIGTTSHAAKILHRNSISIDVDLVSNNYAVNRILKCDKDIFTNEELKEFEGMFEEKTEKEVRHAA